MGQAASIVNDARDAANAKATEAEKQTEAELNNLSILLEARSQQFMSKLIANKGEDKTVPIKTIVDYKIHRSVSVSTEPSKELNTAIEDMFGGNFLSSLKAVTMAALSAVLGKSTAGENTDIGYKLLLLNSAIVRVDYYVYGINLYTSTGLIDRKKNGLAFVAVVGVVDLKQVGLETLVYLVGQQANQASQYVRERVEQWKNRKTRLATDPEVKTDNNGNKLDSNNAVIMANGKPVKPDPKDLTKAKLDDWLQQLDSEYAPEAGKVYKGATGAKLDPTVFADQKEILNQKIDEVLASYTKTQSGIVKDQEEILDTMKRIYAKAADVVSGVGKIGI